MNGWVGEWSKTSLTQIALGGVCGADARHTWLYAWLGADVLNHVHIGARQVWLCETRSGAMEGTGWECNELIQMGLLYRMS